MKEKIKKNIYLLVYIIMSIILIVIFYTNYNSIKSNLNSNIILIKTIAFINILSSFILTLLFNIITIYKIIFRKKTKYFINKNIEKITFYLFVVLIVFDMFISNL